MRGCCSLMKKALPFRSKEFPGQFDHSAGEQQQCDEVRDAHQAVEGIGDAPQQSKVHGSAQNGYQSIHHKEGARHFVTLAQEHQKAGAVQTPADDGGKGKAAQRHSGKNGRSVETASEMSFDFRRTYTRTRHMAR